VTAIISLILILVLLLSPKVVAAVNSVITSALGSILFKFINTITR